MEDRYETRLRAVIDAKLKGEGIEPIAEEEDAGSNVIDLMAALKRSLGQGGAAEAKTKGAAKAKAKAAPAEEEGGGEAGGSSVGRLWAAGWYPKWGLYGIPNGNTECLSRSEFQLPPLGGPPCRKCCRSMTSCGR